MPAAPDDVLLLVPTRASIAALLHRLASAEPRRREDLEGTANVDGGSGGQLGRFLEIGSWFLKTALDRAYDPTDPSLRRELERERLRQRLEIYPPGRRWFLSRGHDEKVWVCSLTPRFETLRELMNRDPDEERYWNLFLRALGWTLEVLDRWNVVLDCNPNNFGVAEDRLYYLDDDILPECGQVAWLDQALLRLREYPHADPELRRGFVRRLLDLLRGYDSRALERWGVITAPAPSLWPPEPELREMLSELTAGRRPRARGKSRARTDRAKKTIDE